MIEIRKKTGQRQSNRLLANRLRAAGDTLVADGALPGQARYFVEDPFGNRLKLLQAPR